MSDQVLLLCRTQPFRDLVAPMLSGLEASVSAHDLESPLRELLSAGEPVLAVVELGDAPLPTVERLRRLRQRLPGCAVLAVARPAGASQAVELMNDALDDYVLEPPLAGDLLARCRRLLHGRGLHRRLDMLQVELNRRYGAHRIVCRSNAMEAVYQRVLQLAPARTTVLITGESGAGKELVARSLHYNSDRRDHPFVAMNCAAVPETLIDSDLFGHDRGAFTGAVATVPGKFELADGGTLFLDEVGSMGLATQVRLLRVLEEGEFMRVGGKRTIRADVRVLAATNTDLEQQVAGGEFRKDLMYRLKVATIDVPPLRRRRDDIPPLARSFVRQLCEESGVPQKDLAPETVRLLSEHDWPGNVRELKNLLESLVVMVPEPVLRPEHLPESLRGISDAAAQPLPEGLTLEELEKAYVRQCLGAHGGNRTRTAKALGIGLRTLQRKIQRFGIDIPPPASS